jgi:ankyrin
VNALAKNNWTPLYLACSWGKLATARLLLNNGANALSETDSGETALHAVANGRYESEKDGVRIAQLLLERGVNAAAQAKDQHTPLHVASDYGKLEIVRLLLDHCADVNMEDDHGETPLHRVSWDKYKSQGGVHIAQLLLDRGADVNAQNKKHRTPLHVACYMGKLEIARLLLDRGANVNPGDGHGETPFHKVSCGDCDSEITRYAIARLLLERGGNVNAQRKDYWTPLHLASKRGKLEIARLLLGHGAKVDASNEFGKTPLHEVSQGTHESEDACVGVARLLLACGGDVNAQDKKHRTPLHLASYYAKLGIVRLLLHHGFARVNAVDNVGRTSLHYVSMGKYDSEAACVSVARLLLEQGAHVNAPSKRRRTPLHVAAYFGKPKIARLLLEHGARGGAVDEQGDTPLHDVSQGEYDSEDAGVGAARLLLARGADANARSRSGGTPLDLASQRPKVAQLLLEHGTIAGADPLPDPERPRASSSRTGFFKR